MKLVVIFCSTFGAGTADVACNIQAMFVPSTRMICRPSASCRTSSTLRQGTVRSRVEHRRADDEAVGFHCLLDEPVRHVVVEDAAVVAALGATAAAQAAANGVAPDPGDLGVDALCFQRAGYFGQRGVGAALLVRTPVDQQNFHEPRLVSRLASFAREPG